MPYPFELVMFDLDGTLIETAPEICDAVNDTLTQFNLPTVAQSLVNDWIGHGTYELLVKALTFVGHLPANGERDRTKIQAIASVFDHHYHLRCGTRSQLYPMVRETLVALRERQVKTAVVTNKEGRYTTTVLKAHGLLELFDTVISGDSLSTKKPDPAGIHQCLNQWGVDKSKALFVGDSSIDIATAHNAGVAVWALPYGYNMGQPIQAAAPDKVIDNCYRLIDDAPPRA